MADDFIKVLVVEDEPTLRDVAQRVLTLQGFQVRTASNGIDALQTLAQYVPNVILLDVLMPVMDGREFLRNLDTSKLPETKIIITSNIADQTIIDEMLRLGAHDHLLKSAMTPNILVDLVQKHSV